MHAIEIAGQDAKRESSTLGQGRKIVVADSLRRFLLISGRVRLPLSRLFLGKSITGWELVHSDLEIGSGLRVDRRRNAMDFSCHVSSAHRAAGLRGPCAVHGSHGSPTQFQRSILLGASLAGWNIQRGFPFGHALCLALRCHARDFVFCLPVVQTRPRYFFSCE